MSGEEMVHCPYVYSHMVMKSRMPSHLIKCRQSKCPQVVEKFVTCPFNTTHDVPETELQYHVEICPDRRNLENFVYIVGDAKPQSVASHLDVPASSENWDEEDTGGASYLDVKDKKLENEKVFRGPVGLTKAQRKAFFQNEVSKFASQESQEKESNKASTSVGKRREAEDK